MQRLAAVGEILLLLQMKLGANLSLRQHCQGVSDRLSKTNIMLT